MSYETNKVALSELEKLAFPENLFFDDEVINPNFATGWSGKVFLGIEHFRGTGIVLGLPRNAATWGFKVLLSDDSLRQKRLHYRRLPEELQLKPDYEANFTRIPYYRRASNDGYDEVMDRLGSLYEISRLVAHIPIVEVDQNRFPEVKFLFKILQQIEEAAQ